MKKIHFEDVWVAAEKSCSAANIQAEHSIKELQNNLILLSENPEYYIGQILLHTANLSNFYKVNTWDALQKANTDLLVDYFEP